MKIFYRATDYKNLGSILTRGIEVNGMEQSIFLADSPLNAAKFVCVRGIKKILVAKVKIYKADEHKIQESFEHSIPYFGCRAWTYADNIPTRDIVEYTKYKL